MELPSDQPGYFQIFIGPMGSGWYFLFNCPCGCGTPGIVPIELQGETSRTEFEQRHPSAIFWRWDGDLERPTLSPSLRRNIACKVHFNVEKGKYTIHPDGAPAAPNCFTAAPER